MRPGLREGCLHARHGLTHKNADEELSIDYAKEGRTSERKRISFWRDEPKTQLRNFAIEGSAAMITIVDYGVGNVAALVNMYDDLGFESQVTREKDEIAAADKLILPGVGAFDTAMRTLRFHGLVAPLEHAVLQRGVPILGICLGMQLLARRSEEGTEPGLGWIPADVIRIDPRGRADLKVPHIGWAVVRPLKPSPLFAFPAREAERFYFVHSYHVCCDDPADRAAIIEYGSEICCSVARENISGVQFHPEKSHRFGKRLLRDFAVAECPV